MHPTMIEMLGDTRAADRERDLAARDREAAARREPRPTRWVRFVEAILPAQARPARPGLT